MRAQFTRGIDPKTAMGVGLMQRFKDVITALQDAYVTNFDENDLTYMVTASNNYDSEPEDFHNPAGHPAYDWEEVYVRSDFQVIHEATVDLKNNRLIYTIWITNPDIPNFKWSDTSTVFIDANASPADILELVEEEFSTYDVYEAATVAKEKADENVQEGEEEIEEVLGESMNENEEYDSSDNGFVDVEDNIDGSVTISYKHQTGEDEYDIDETRSIDPYHMDTYMALKLGLSLKAVHDEDVNIMILNIKKQKDDTWLFVTNWGSLTLTLGDLEKLADKR